MMKQILSLTRKELSSYFSSPMALIFLGTFLGITLFTFFWVDTFFARGIADIRPLFRWMPLLLIFLVAALTMRQWSEEQRSGTLEMLLTLPVRPAQLVLGKFLAVMALVLVALALTLPLPISVSTLGNLDWGPVIGGYLAAILLAAAYTAIGLYVSSRTDNQIVALIATALLGGLFYLVGTGGVTDFAGGIAGDVLRALGTGSRFESIERGVIDVRDLVYYLSLAGIFLVLNTLSLDSKRWSEGERTYAYRRGIALTATLVGLNLVLLNVWVFPLQGLRVDLTQQQEFSLSQTTKDLLANLQEPLTLRAYLSNNTHPLLAPLIPRIRDLLREYQIVSNGKVTAEVVDPAQDPAIEAEANQTYGIQPTPLQVAGRYEASLINAYFDILVRYADQSTTLNFRDLIEVEPRRDGTVDVRLRNLEYDLTRSIKRVVYGFQSVDTVLAAMAEPVKLTLITTPNSLPEPLQSAPDTISQVAQEIAGQSNGKFTFEVIDPDAPGSAITRQTLQDTYKLQAIPVSLFSDQTYYLDMLLTIGENTQVLSPGSDLSEASIRTAIESGLKRASSGFLKVVGLWTPPPTPTQDAFGQMQQPISGWQLLNQQLGQDYTVRSVDLSTGQLPSDIDTLVIVAPQNLTDKDRYAIDQYLMRGGSVIVAAGNYVITTDPFGGGLGLQTAENGLQEMLDSYGIRVGQELVMDPQNEPFPVQVMRNVGGFQVQEIQALNYPFFPDIRPDAMDREHPIVSRLAAVTLNWASPVELDTQKNTDRTTSVLLQSSPQAWLRTNTNIQPDPDAYPGLGFPVEGEQKAYPLAVSVQGAFQSYFKDKPSPFQSQAPNPLDSADQPSLEPTATPAPGETQSISTIEESPASARLVVVGSAEFVDDAVLELSSRLTQDRYLNNLQFVQNAVDWSVEDLDLLDIRARGTLTRVLKPMEPREQSLWEALNYGIALVALVGIGAIWRARRRSEQPMVLVPQASSK
ncbi:MAG TPA: Gldg family protein [Anaerolineae bacterium]|nr:Gldg family protein [Anaerolineae bacterium]